MVELAISGLDVTFVGLDLSGFTHISLKIENGVVFLKPVAAVSKGRRGADTFPIDYHATESINGNPVTIASCFIKGVLIDRIEAYLVSRGWSSRTPFLPLHLASRGWFAMSFDATPVPSERVMGVEIVGHYESPEAMADAIAAEPAKAPHLAVKRSGTINNGASRNL